MKDVKEDEEEKIDIIDNNENSMHNPMIKRSLGPKKNRIDDFVRKRVTMVTPKSKKLIDSSLLIPVIKESSESHVTHLTNEEKKRKNSENNNKVDNLSKSELNTSNKNEENENVDKEDISDLTLTIQKSTKNSYQKNDADKISIKSEEIKLKSKPIMDNSNNLENPENSVEVIESNFLSKCDGNVKDKYFGELFEDQSNRLRNISPFGNLKT